MNPAEERLAQNEALFRDVNERVQALRERSGAFHDDDSLEEFLCECGDEVCLEKIPLTRAEYGEARAGREQFLIVPGHEVAGAERVLRENDRYALVAKA